ncbi:MAG: hypothetical protein JHC73_20935, partial [Dolichospermum sp.]|nr:hypothetical protein [Dolichospermum sp.]
DPLYNYTYNYTIKDEKGNPLKTIKLIDFISLQMAQDVNIINGDLGGTPIYKIKGAPPQPSTVKYYSIAWSNYGEVFILADKRMPHTILLLFRGTNSAKSTAIYLKPTSLIGLSVCEDSKGNPQKFLYGMFKVTTEVIHTIIESIRSLAVDFLGATSPNSVKIFSTGHSLGGAMSEIFSYLWVSIKNTPPYNSPNYGVLAENIICVSLGAPRCMNKLVADNFCALDQTNKILFIRIVTFGDPVPDVPLEAMGFRHPCFDNNKLLKNIFEGCQSLIIVRPTIGLGVSYQSGLKCLNYKNRPYITNPLSHTIYLDIVFTKAVDVAKYSKGAFTEQEILRANGSSVCRIIMGVNATPDFMYKAIFFNMDNIRKINKQDIKQQSSFFSRAASSLSFKIGGPVAEDVRISKEVFSKLVSLMVPLMNGNLNPLQGEMAGVEVFNSAQIMPDLSCPMPLNRLLTPSELSLISSNNSMQPVKSNFMSSFSSPMPQSMTTPQPMTTTQPMTPQRKSWFSRGGKKRTKTQKNKLKKHKKGKTQKRKNKKRKGKRITKKT